MKNVAGDRDTRWGTLNDNNDNKEGESTLPLSNISRNLILIVRLRSANDRPNRVATGI